MIISIKENHLYQKCYHKGKRWCGRYVAVYVLKDLRAEKYRRMMPDKKRVNRVGLTVTKKVGGAVVRSRVRRILREAVRLNMKNAAGREEIRTGFLVVIAAREAAAHAKTQDIMRELEKAYRATGLCGDGNAKKPDKSDKAVGTGKDK